MTNSHDQENYEDNLSLWNLDQLRKVSLNYKTTVHKITDTVQLCPSRVKQ